MTTKLEALRAATQAADDHLDGCLRARGDSPEYQHSLYRSMREVHSALRCILAHLEAREGKGRRYMSGDHVYREHIPGYEPSPEPAPVALDPEHAGVNRAALVRWAEAGWKLSEWLRCYSEDQTRLATARQDALIDYMGNLPPSLIPLHEEEIREALKSGYAERDAVLFGPRPTQADAVQLTRYGPGPQPHRRPKGERPEQPPADQPDESDEEMARRAYELRTSARRGMASMSALPEMVLTWEQLDSGDRDSELAAYRFACDIGRAERDDALRELSDARQADGETIGRLRGELAEAKAELVSHREALDIQIEKLVKSKAELAEAKARIASALARSEEGLRKCNRGYTDDAELCFDDIKRILSPEHRPAPEKGE